MTGRVQVARTTPAGLANALDERNATITWRREEGQRTYLRAETAEGELFGWYTLDQREREMVAREALIRASIGVSGALRAPPLLDHGDNWRLERFIHSAPLRGEGPITTAVRAAEELSRLTIPDGPPSFDERRHLALLRRARVSRSPLPVRDFVRARALYDRSRLPKVTSHGDFHPIHLLYADGAVWVIDWDLAGLRPAGHDLMQLWGHLEDAEDRRLLYQLTLAIVGGDRDSDLAELRYVALVRLIAACYGERFSINRDPVLGRRLLALLPEVRAPVLRKVAQ